MPRSLRRHACHRSLLVLDVGVDAGAAVRAVGTQADQVEGAVLDRHAVHVWRVPRILQVAFLRVRTQPATGVARLPHPVVERTGQAAGVRLEGMDLYGQLGLAAWG